MLRRTWQRLSLLGISVCAILSAPAAYPRTDSEISLLVWKVTAPAGQDRTPDYLAGTFHLPVPPGRSLPEAVRKAIAGSDLFVGEIDANTVTPALLRRWAKLPEGQRNSKRLPKAVWQKVSQEAAGMGMPQDVADVLAPWYLCIALSTRDAKLNQIRDVMLHEEAKRRHLRSAYLESLAEQFELLAKLPLSAFDEQLAKSGCRQTQYDPMLALYDKSDIAGLTEAFVPPEGVRKEPAVYERLYFHRNRSWLPKIERAMTGNRAFIAIGIGHLLGDQGLLAALKAKGYQVELVPM